MIDEKLIEAINNGECLPPEGYKLNDEKTDLISKSEAEILADDWNTSIERRCEYVDFLTNKIDEMQTYLNDTDWFVTRMSETEKEMPSDVKETREEYRIKISLYKEKLKEANKEFDDE